MRPEARPHDISRTRVLLLALLGAVLIWLIVTRSLAAALATSSPSTALLLQPAEPTALLTLAKAELEKLLSSPQPLAPAGEGPEEPPDRLSGLSRLAEIALLTQGQAAGAPEASSVLDPAAAPSAAAAPTAEHADRIVKLAASVLAADPLNADALGVLAQLAEARRDANTGALMQAAARLSIRESYAHYWLLQEARQQGDADAILRQADTLLRTRPRTLPLVLPALGRLAEQSGGAEKVGAMLAANPPWRANVLSKLPQVITDARTPLYLLLGLVSSPHPPTPVEISRYIDFLNGRNFHELAYYTWLQFLPSERLASLTPLNNAGFDAPPSESSFDWTIREGTGSTTEIRPRPDLPDGSALFVEFTQGRAEFPGVYQTVLLGPGSYQLRGKFKGTLIGQRGLVWRVSCIGKRTLGQTDMMHGDVPQWRSFELTVTVPPEDCRAQQIRLVLDARSASEKFVTGSMWIDDLELIRTGGS